MKAETKLNKILKMEDGNSKAVKLFIFCCRVLPHCELWEIAYTEYNRLWQMGYK